MTSSATYAEGVPPPDNIQPRNSVTSNRIPVLDYLRTRETPPTVHEIAEDLGLAKITVRRHLSALIELGYVEVVGQRPRAGYKDRECATSRGLHLYAAVNR
jgi:DNA-binding transcriptional ArsR family regulator